MDRIWWLHVIHASRLMDERYYGAQRGWRRTSRFRAEIDYVFSGFRAGISPNPLFDELFVSAALPDKGRVPALYAYLVSDRVSVRVHPWWNQAVSPADLPEVAETLEEAWRDRAHSSVRVRVGAVSEAVPISRWCEIARASAVQRAIPPARAMADRVVRLLQGSDERAHLKVDSAVAAVDQTGVLLTCVGVEPSSWSSVAIAARMTGAGALRLEAGTPYADAVRSSLGDASGVLVVVDPRATAETVDLMALLEGGGRAVVAPIMLDADGTLSAIGSGVVIVDGRPRLVEIFGGHPREDLVPLSGRTITVPLATGRSFAAPAALVRAHIQDWTPGLELESLSAAASATVPVEVDTAVILGGFAPANAFAAVPVPDAPLPPALADRRDEAELLNLFSASQFELERWTERGARAAPRLRRSRERAARQRWAIKTSAPAGPAGDVWGDAHFARGLASALRRLGHEVVVDAFEAAERATSYLDDVHVVVRGPFRIMPPASGVRIEWIISHPDEITAEEVAGFDLVFAVSPGWAERATSKWGTTILPLWECTDADLFRASGRPRTAEIVFVGTARGIARPAVVAPLAAGIDVRVYGPDWRGFIPAHAIAATSIPNPFLAARYETAAAVLNDHWPAMRREGFMAMRPFDVVAAGGRVISEHIPGMAEIFEGAVVEYRDPEHLVHLLRQDLNALFPDDARLAEISAKIRAEHSFDARAASLDAAVRELTELSG